MASASHHSFRIIWACQDGYEQHSSSLPCPVHPPSLKLKFSQYSSIHTNYIIPHCTTLHIIIIFDTVLGRNEFANPKDNEFNRAAISLLWHPPAMLCSGQINVAGIRRR